jgi:hypothetical protein
MMGHANASITLNVYSHLVPKERDGSGDRLASLVFGNKLETGYDASVGSDGVDQGNSNEINELSGGQGGSRAKRLRFSRGSNFDCLKI